MDFMRYARLPFTQAIKMTKEIDDWMTPEELARELWGDYLGEGDMPGN